MKLFIPPLGTQLELEAPWTFGLYQEYRNDDFVGKLRYPGRYSIPIPKANQYGYTLDGVKLCDFTLPIGTKLKVARIYIRAGQKGFDSVSFNVNFIATNGQEIKSRFWAKLEDVNKLEASVIN